MARAIWTGTISFGLVSVPVRLYPATRRKDVRFHEIDRLSGQRIRHQKVVEVTPTQPPPRGGGDDLAQPGREISRIGEDDGRPHPALPSRGRELFEPQGDPRSGPDATRPVAAGDVVKGFEVARDRYVTVDTEELEELAPERTRTIDVEQFVDASAVDPIFFDVSYYVAVSYTHLTLPTKA